MKEIEQLEASLPPGWRIVPEQPTLPMIEAALADYMSYERGGPNKQPWNCLTMWAAMLRAAPRRLASAQAQPPTAR